MLNKIDLNDRNVINTIKIIDRYHIAFEDKK